MSNVVPLRQPRCWCGSAHDVRPVDPIHPCSELMCAKHRSAMHEIYERSVESARARFTTEGPQPA